MFVFPIIICEEEEGVEEEEEVPCRWRLGVREGRLGERGEGKELVGGGDEVRPVLVP